MRAGAGGDLPRHNRGGVRMKTLIMAVIAAASLAVAGAAAAALVPGVFDPDNTGCLSRDLRRRRPAPGEELPDSDERRGRCRHHRPRGSDVHVRIVHAGERERSARAARPASTSLRRPGLFFLGCNNVTPTTTPTGRRPTCSRRRRSRRRATRCRSRPGRSPQSTCWSMSRARPTSRRSQSTESCRCRRHRSRRTMQERGLEELHDPVVQEPGRLRQLLRHRRQQPRQRVTAEPRLVWGSRFRLPHTGRNRDRLAGETLAD